MKDLPRAAQGSTVVLEADVYNTIVDTLIRLDSWSVAPPLQLVRDGAGNHLSSRGGPFGLALVQIIGTESGGGRYKGTLLSGLSTGSTSTNFQLRPSLTQSATDGPVAQTGSGGYANNALVINILEQFVGSHMLWAPEGQLSPPSGWGAFFAFGRIMGQTNENPSRTIVYIEGWPMAPIWAKITVQASNGQYNGRIFPGHVADYLTQAGPIYSNSSGDNSYLEVNLPSTDNCWINNAFEQRAQLLTCQLPVGVYVPGFIVGFTNQPGSAAPWYAVWTMTPPYASDLADQPQALQCASYTAGSMPTESALTYGVNEQHMLNAIKADIENLYATLVDLYQNLKNAGYIGQQPEA
jgi:hypothetical protein